MPNMRAKESVSTFVQEFLRRHGGDVSPIRKNAIQVSFRRKPPFADKRSFVVAFERKALSHHPDAKLAIQGSPFYLSLLDAAKATGNAARVFTPIVEPLPELPGGRWIRRANPDFEVRPGETTNDAHVVFTFALSFQSVVTSDDLISIAYDVRRKAFRDTRIVDALHSVWSETLDASPGEWPTGPVPAPSELVPAALQELEKRAERRVARAKRNAELYLEQEIQNVEDYYRQLIAEEKEILNRVSRTSPKEADERKKRIHRYQLDWKRRIAEEARHHQCRVHIRLVSASVVYMPRTALFLRAEATEPDWYFNHFLGTLDGLVCADRGIEIGPWEQRSSGEWISLAEQEREGPAPDASDIEENDAAAAVDHEEVER